MRIMVVNTGDKSVTKIHYGLIIYLDDSIVFHGEFLRIGRADHRGKDQVVKFLILPSRAARSIVYNMASAQ